LYGWLAPPEFTPWTGDFEAASLFDSFEVALSNSLFEPFFFNICNFGDLLLFLEEALPF
jgi:hypothetical protein